MHTQRCTLLNEAVSTGKPFAGFGKEIQKSIEKEIEIFQPVLLSDVQEIFSMILEDFNSTFVVEEIPNPMRDLLRCQIRKFADEAQATINGPLQIELATAMKVSV